MHYFATLLPCLLGFLSLAAAGEPNDNCPCGYRSRNVVYTDLMETDFTQITDMYKQKTGWDVQEWERNSTDATPLGQVSSRANVKPTPDGLRMYVTRVNETFVGRAEMATTRTDMRYGSYRVGLITTATRGTCGAFFWYFNDTEEIDMEFLSSQDDLRNDNNSYVNLVMHSKDSQRENFDASKTSTFDKFNLSFSPSSKFSEYRMDYSPEGVNYFVDGAFAKNMDENVPISPGRLFLNHWSGGNPGWGGGPPEKDTYMTVLYVKAYFNSSNPDRIQKTTARCDRAKVKKVCETPDVDPHVKTNLAPGKVPFLSSNPANIVDQVKYSNKVGGRSAASHLSVGTQTNLIVLMALTVWIGTW